MGLHHLISIDEDQLRNWQGDPDELLSNIGSAVVLACLDRTNAGVIIRENTSQAHGDQPGDAVSVVHVSQHEGDEFAVWAWASGDSVCIADLPDEDLELIIKLAHAVRMGTVRAPSNIPPGV